MDWNIVKQLVSITFFKLHQIEPSALVRQMLGYIFRPFMIHMLRQDLTTMLKMHLDSLSKLGSDFAISWFHLWATEILDLLHPEDVKQLL